MQRNTEAKKWIQEHPGDVQLFREAYENNQMSNVEIANMFSIPVYQKTGENSSSAPLVSVIARELGLKPKHVHVPRAKHENAFSKVERLKRELAEAQKEQMREAQNDENKIRKFVESMGGVAAFNLKFRMIRWS
jgi:hypothetical protein